MDTNVDLYNKVAWPALYTDAYNELLAEAKANAPTLDTQNFEINVWDYDVEDVPQLTPELLAHEWPWSHPFWREVEEMYKSAAIGYSEELKGKALSRLCSYLVVRARPSGDSSCILHMSHSDSYKAANYTNTGESSEFNSPHNIILTGQFVDMPDGRWHYVYLSDLVQRNSYSLFYKYLNIEYLNFLVEEQIRIYEEEFGESPSEDELAQLLAWKDDFRFGFVREDLIGQIKDEYSKFYTDEYWGKYKDDTFAYTPYLLKELPAWISRDRAINVTDQEIGIKMPYNLLLQALKQEGDENHTNSVLAMNLPRLFSRYPSNRWVILDSVLEYVESDSLWELLYPDEEEIDLEKTDSIFKTENEDSDFLDKAIETNDSSVYYKAAGEEGYIVYENGFKKDYLANLEIYTTSTGEDRYNRVWYRQPFDLYTPLFPEELSAEGYNENFYPGYYDYNYHYIANAENGYYYFYILEPARRARRINIDALYSYFGNEFEPGRVMAFPNGGDASMGKDVANDIYKKFWELTAQEERNRLFAFLLPLVGILSLNNE